MSLTVGKYTHTALFDLSGAVGTLPDPSAGGTGESETLRMTGTAGVIGMAAGKGIGRSVAKGDFGGGKSGGNFAPRPALNDTVCPHEGMDATDEVVQNPPVNVSASHTLASSSTSPLSQPIVALVGLEPTRFRGDGF